MKPDFAKLHKAFNPRCVAVVGDKEKFPWLSAQSSFQGKLYSVQISQPSIQAVEAMGIKNYTSLLEIPDEIDLVIVSVPRAAASKILDDCIKKGVAAAHFFTAGFSETGTGEGIRLEKQLAERAERAGFHLIGPNCMGIFNPEVGVRQNKEQYTGFSGSVGFISQSGTHARYFALEGHIAGVDVNKSVSFGNGSVLDAPDFLEYFGQEAGIKAIGMYLEGIRNGRRFLSILKEVSSRKPVVIWKGGRTEEGARATSSHTASLAVSQTIWDAAVKQCGAVNSRNMQELIDTLKILLYVSPIYGNRVAIAGGSGGQAVAISDAFAEGGLVVPTLTQKSYDTLSSFFSLIGASYRNPIDTGLANRKETWRILRILEQDANIDNLVIVTLAEPGLTWNTPEELENEIRTIIDFRQSTNKPVIVILPAFTPRIAADAININRKLRDGGVPSFPTFERTARALRNALDYYSSKSGENAPENRIPVSLRD